MEMEKDFMAPNQIFVRVFKGWIWVNSVFIDSAPVCLLLPADKNQRWRKRSWGLWWGESQKNERKKQRGEVFRKAFDPLSFHRPYVPQSDTVLILRNPCAAVGAAETLPTFQFPSSSPSAALSFSLSSLPSLLHSLAIKLPRTPPL